VDGLNDIAVVKILFYGLQLPSYILFVGWCLFLACILFDTCYSWMDEQITILCVLPRDGEIQDSRN
jgi:hypothetical protein